MADSTVATKIPNNIPVVVEKGHMDVFIHLHLNVQMTRIQTPIKYPKL